MVRPKSHPEDADGSITSAGSGKSPFQAANRNSSLIEINLGACYSFVLCNCLFHHRYVRKEGHEDSDVISIRGYLHRETTGEQKTVQNRTSTPMYKPSEQGLLSEDIEKWRQGTSQSDRPDFSCYLVYLYSGNCNFFTRLSEGASVHRKLFLLTLSNNKILCFEEELLNMMYFILWWQIVSKRSAELIPFDKYSSSCVNNRSSFVDVGMAFLWLKSQVIQRFLKTRDSWVWVR